MTNEPFIDINGMVGVINDDHEIPTELFTLDDLIARAVSPDMLDDEPEAARLLSEFLGRIEKSRAIVAMALDNLKEMPK